MSPPSHISSNVAELGRDELKQRVCTDHSWQKCCFMTVGLSMCITVDILQYSMPLAFLPSVLEDRGHRPMTIATAIGVYYWTGFAGGCLITGYKVFRLVVEEEVAAEDAIVVGHVRRQLVYLVWALALSTVTLMGQALWPQCWMHTLCRFLQGLAGAFIFFYTFLLSVGLFKGSQQVMAMTVASTALNVAEVVGSGLGAWVFDNWGQRVVFWFLMLVSILTQGMLVAIYAHVRGDGGEEQCESPWSPRPNIYTGWCRLLQVVSSKRLGCSVLLIVFSAMVKASVEEVLPFHADHRWGMKPLEIGHLFFIVAVAYISAAVFVGRMWEYVKEFRVLFGATWLVLLGFSAWAVLMTETWFKHEGVFTGFLALYGAGLGFTHTPAALMLADAVDHERGVAKDAANAIWNTMWEAGGSLGFLLGGLLGETYRRQVLLFGAYAGICVISAGLMMLIGGWRARGRELSGALLTPRPSPQPPESAPKSTSLLKSSLWEAGYGGTAARA